MNGLRNAVIFRINVRQSKVVSSLILRMSSIQTAFRLWRTLCSTLPLCELNQIELEIYSHKKAWFHDFSSAASLKLNELSWFYQEESKFPLNFSDSCTKFRFDVSNKAVHSALVPICNPAYSRRSLFSMQCGTLQPSLYVLPCIISFVVSHKQLPGLEVAADPVRIPVNTILILIVHVFLPWKYLFLANWVKSYQI